ncbi:MAG: M23 family metallopeptidase [Anaerovoracaceae bacterium]
MRPIQNKKGKDKVAVVLMLCFCVIALTSIFTIKANIDKISSSQPDVPVSDKTTSEKNTPPDTSDDKNVSVTIPTVDSKEKNAGKPKEEASFIKPISKTATTISKDYSMDMVIYSKTLDQFMTHSGIDLEAPEDTQVVAIAAGTVTKVSNDGGLGITIEIAHKNGYISKYCNLSTDKMVEEGDTVSQGEIISGVGKTAMFESLEPAHLHLEIIKDGKCLNPNKFIKF